MPELTYAQERDIDKIDQVTAGMCGVIRQVLGNKKDEAKALIDQIVKVRDATVGELLKPPKDNANTKSFGP